MRAVKESAERVNGKEVYLIHEPMAAAIGIGVDIMQPKGNTLNQHLNVYTQNSTIPNTNREMH